MSDDLGARGMAVGTDGAPQEEPILYAVVELLLRDVQQFGTTPDTGNQAQKDLARTRFTIALLGLHLGAGSCAIECGATKLADAWCTSLSSPNGPPRSGVPAQGTLNSVAIARKNKVAGPCMVLPEEPIPE